MCVFSYVPFLLPKTLKNQLRNRKMALKPCSRAICPIVRFFAPIFGARGSAERIWGEFFILVRCVSGKLPANVSANFDGESFPQMFRSCFSRISSPPPPKKTSCPELSAFLSNFTFSSPKLFHADFLLNGEDQFFLGAMILLLEASCGMKGIAAGPLGCPLVSGERLRRFQFSSCTILYV